MKKKQKECKGWDCDELDCPELDELIIIEEPKEREDKK
jgi:hypothetical protein